MIKRDLFKDKQTRLAKKESQGTKEALRESLGLEGSKIVRATFTLPESDIQWLTEIVRGYKRSSPRTISKSEIVRIGLHLVKKQGLENSLKMVV